ncbi:MAG: hypothetical protein AAF633_12395 [Chloroflexota bacterium]
MMSWAVFKQAAASRPHQMVGSVHAADADMALLQARSVFARRPRAVSMWVTPMASTLTWSHEDAEQLLTETPPLDSLDIRSDAEKSEVWQVFRKVGKSRSMTFVDHVGVVDAASADSASDDNGDITPPGMDDGMDDDDGSINPPGMDDGMDDDDDG